MQIGSGLNSTVDNSIAVGNWIIQNAVCNLELYYLSLQCHVPILQLTTEAPRWRVVPIEPARIDIIRSRRYTQACKLVIDNITPLIAIE